MMASRSRRARLSLKTICADADPVHGAVATHGVGAEALADRGQPRRARRHHFARQDVGVHDRHARLADLGGDIALAGRDAARQRNPANHIAAFPVARSSAAVTVLRRTMATVSGPTPPGTGVSAPATSSTSGCTSPTSTLPFC